VRVPLKLSVKLYAKYFYLWGGELLDVPYLNRCLEVVFLARYSKVDKLVLVRCKLYPMSLGLV
jgi:hypothetical protein